MVMIAICCFDVGSPSHHEKCKSESFPLPSNFSFSKGIHSWYVSLHVLTHACIHIHTHTHTHTHTPQHPSQGYSPFKLSLRDPAPAGVTVLEAQTTLAPPTWQGIPCTGWALLSLLELAMRFYTSREQWDRKLLLGLWKAEPTVCGTYLWSEVKVAQSCLTLCHPMNYTVLGILQDWILE